MDLLERSSYLAELDGLLRQAAAGHGQLLFLGGEAGVGKSSLVRHFAGQVQATTRVLTGSCDPLSTPRPLGPLIDIGEQAGGDIARRLQESSARSELYKAVLAEFDSQPATLVIIEDAHWADEATLDLIRHLGRRLGPIPALVVVTYREDEVGGDHPLRRVLGDLATSGTVRRLALRRLSLNAVITMAAGTAIDPIELHKITGGNPFFVTEVIALDESGVPPTVRDAVLARASRLSPEGKRVLEACAVIGSPIEPWLLMRVEAKSDSVAECLDRGILINASPNLAFRHELARRAVLETTTPVSRLHLHARVLEELRETPARNHARLAHHAEEAGDAEAVLEFAPAAAERAAALGSHLEAAAQYARALRFADGLSPERRANLLEAYSYECFVTDQLEKAIAACEEAFTIWRSKEDHLREGNAQRFLSRIYWFSGRNADAERAGRVALDILETLPPSPELAKAYSNLSQLRMLASDSSGTIAWGNKAIALAERLGETETKIHALTNVGSIRFLVDIDRGCHEVEESLAFALKAGYEDHAARAYAVLGSNFTELYQLPKADRILLDGVAHCSAHDLEGMRLYLVGWRATSLMFQGQWSEATGLAGSVLAHPHLSPPSRIVSLAALGRVQARQGNPAAWATLDKALELAMATGELQRIAPVRAARAEAAWLAGDMPRVLAEARAMYDESIAIRHIWYAGQFAFWLWRSGEAPSYEDLFEPFALQIAGNWKEAAARWRDLGCPYESASALADSNDEADLRYALSEFNRLGAAPAAAKVSQQLRVLAASNVRRRVRDSTEPFTPPQTSYAKSGDVNIAYQVVGEGPLDLVFVMGWVSNLELFWEGPSAGFLRRLASFSRLIIFDKRGTGLSDRVTELPTIEQRMDDVRAVMEAAGSQRAALFGISEGAAMCAVFAATFPERTSALLIYGGYAKRIWSPDYPWAPTPLERQVFYDTIEHGWGGVVDLDTLAPSAAGDPEIRDWWAAYMRRSASPGAALALARMNTEIDIRPFLSAIRVPTLVLHRTGDLDIDVGGARYLADRIPDARYVELPGSDHLVFAGDQNAILDEVELFLTGALPVPQPDRVLATIASVEIADATDRAATMGDWKWQAILQAHEHGVAEALVRFRGEPIKSTADGLLASFDGPGRAIRFAGAVADAARTLGIETRAGLHTGECEKTEESLAGIALHIASRIMFRADPGQVVVSSTVKDLVAGSGIAFEDLGAHVFTELPGEWRLYRAQRDSSPATSTQPRATVATEPVPSTTSPLTRREREIAVLIVRGLSNRQIAAELFISPATVERHVSNIFNKLGFHSRAQIAAWVVEHDLAAGQQ